MLDRTDGRTARDTGISGEGGHGLIKEGSETFAKSDGVPKRWMTRAGEREKTKKKDRRRRGGGGGGRRLGKRRTSSPGGGHDTWGSGTHGGREGGQRGRRVGR